MHSLKDQIKQIIPYWLGKEIKEIYRLILGLIYKGNKYHCPYCKHNFRKMLSDGETLEVISKFQIIGSGYRDNCTCPRCYSKDRDRLIHLYLEKKTNIFTSQHKLLHIAPEDWLKKLFQALPNIEYIFGVKGVKSMGYYYDPETIELDLTNLKMSDASFDAIICNHVLEHIPDDKKAISEIYRVLKPGAWAILQVPYSAMLKDTFEDENINLPEERAKFFGQFDHVRIYGKDYKNRLELAGFKVELFNPANEVWSEKYIEKYALNRKEDLFIAHKPL